MSESHRSDATVDPERFNRVADVWCACGGDRSQGQHITALQRYLDWIDTRFGTVELRGITRGDEQIIQLSLGDVYVHLQTEALPASGKGSGSGPSRKIEQTSGSGNPTTRQLLAEGKRLVVTGAPGCGKTTILYYVAWTLAKAILTGETSLVREHLGLSSIELPVPLYVPLSLYAGYLSDLGAGHKPAREDLASFLTSFLGQAIDNKFLAQVLSTLLHEDNDVVFLLDGFDEVSNSEERDRLSRHMAAVAQGSDRAYFVVASRERAYYESVAAQLPRDFGAVRIRPLEPNDVRALISKAYHAILPGETDRKFREKAIDDLTARVRRLEEERQSRLRPLLVSEDGAAQMVTTPLMVRMILIAHLNLRQLPEQRAELYMSVVDTLLKSDYNPSFWVAQHLKQLGGDWQLRREMLQFLAHAMHALGRGFGRSISRQKAEETLNTYLVQKRRYVREQAKNLVEEFMTVSRLRGGVFNEDSGQCSFQHMSLQEFLTARYLAEVTRGVEDVAQFFEEGNKVTDYWWREPILLTAGYFNVNSKDAAEDLIVRLSRGGPGEPPCSPSALAAAELAATAFLEWNGPDTIRQSLADRLVTLLTERNLQKSTAAIRRASGRALGYLGDPRRGVGTIEPSDGPALPDLVWCEVPQGKFQMGALPLAENVAVKPGSDEIGVQWVRVSTFYIARYPVTNGQYRLFIEANGYDDYQWWTDSGWAWRCGKDPSPDAMTHDWDRGYVEWITKRPPDRRDRPLSWHDSDYNLPNQPVVGVTWHEAMAYCSWLNSRLLTTGGEIPLWSEGHLRSICLNWSAWRVTLPSEAEWEKAAGWDPVLRQKHTYTWGNSAESEWERARYMYQSTILISQHDQIMEQKPEEHETEREKPLTAAVGIFPRGESAYGALDMTSSAWEWTRSLFRKYPYDPSDCENIHIEGRRALRGGSPSGRVTARIGPHYATFDILNTAFRLVLNQDGAPSA